MLRSFALYRTGLIRGGIAACVSTARQILNESVSFLRYVAPMREKGDDRTADPATPSFPLADGPSFDFNRVISVINRRSVLTIIHGDFVNGCEFVDAHRNSELNGNTIN